MSPIRAYILTLIAMMAFAGNSLLCRSALKQTNIDAASFTAVRIVSGAIALWLIANMRKTRSAWKGSWSSAIALFVYAAAFSFAYLSLSAATGALLLFGAVQATMIGWGLWNGEHLRPGQWVGLVFALGGLVALLFPGLSAPPFVGSILMLTAGIAWGVYSLRGKNGDDAISATAGNFLRATAIAAVLCVGLLPSVRFNSAGIGYAILSGAVASGVGYAIWYSALPWLKAANAAAVQLSVPLLAATGGIVLLGEPVTMRFLMASIAILGGIAFVVLEKRSGVAAVE